MRRLIHVLRSALFVVIVVGGVVLGIAYVAVGDAPIIERTAEVLLALLVTLAIGPLFVETFVMGEG